MSEWANMNFITGERSQQITDKPPRKRGGANLDTLPDPDPEPKGATLTHNATSTRFHGFSEPANDQLFDRRKKPTPATPEALPVTRSKYLEIALSPDGGIDVAIEAGKRDTVEKWLFKEQFLSLEDGRLTLNKNKPLSALRGEQKQIDGSTSYPQPKWYVPKDLRDTFGIESDKLNVTATDYLTYLDGRPAYTSESEESIPITTFPSTFHGIVSDAYPPCHIKPWDIPMVKRVLWDRPITLEDGTETNLAELQIAETFRTLQVEAIGNGRFLITDPQSSERRTIVTKELVEKYLPNFGAAHSLALRNRPPEFIQQYLKNLDRLGIFSVAQLRKTSSNYESSIVAPSDRKLNGNASGISLQTPRGKSVVYYVGREKIVGTDIPLDRENTVFRYLDRHTIGIIRQNKDNEEILCTFPLASPDEINTRRDKKQKELIASGQSVTDGRLGAHTHIGGDEMKHRVRRYKISDYLPPLPNEDPRTYADRVAKLSDTRLISKNARQFFQRTGIGLHRLPWSEQLAASSILLDPRFKQEEISAFCQQYGVDGLRTFIASTFGSNINREVLALGKRSPELATVTFQKFGEILAAVDDAKELIQSLALKNEKYASETTDTLDTVENQLLMRAKALLEEIVTTASQTKIFTSAKREALFQKLEAVRSDIIVFTTTFKTLRDDGHEVSMRDFRDSEFSNVSGAELPGVEISRMRTLYADSMRGYPEVTKQKLLADFDQHIHDGKSTFSLLRYKGEIAGFLCFTETNPGQKYVSAVTLDPRFQKAFIGETMIDEAFASEAENNILGADCVAEKSVSARYIENGFIGVHSWDDKGDLIMDIVRDDRRNDRYFATKKLTQAEIIRLAPLGKIGTATVDILDDPKHHDFARCNAGFVLTRYFKDDKTGKWYLVYEPRPSTESPGTQQVEEEKEMAEA